MDKTLKCQICRIYPAFYTRSYEGVLLCKKCFKKSIEKKVRRLISHYNMFTPQDHIGVAVSGGKDSLTLLHLLHHIESSFPKAKLTALAVDEGIKEYREEALNLAKKYTAKLHLELKIISFKKLYGETLDEIVRTRNLKFPCSSCGVLRRRALNELATKVGVDTLATAHNLDDESQTVLLNIIHGNPFQILYSSPILDSGLPHFVKKVKPLSLIPEKEISLYAYLINIPFQKTPCPYSSIALRNDIRYILNILEERHPGTLSMVYSSAEKMRENLQRFVTRHYNKCQVCGFPSSSEICSVCKLLKVTNRGPL